MVEEVLCVCFGVGVEEEWCQGLNPRCHMYESCALPVSYIPRLLRVLLRGQKDPNTFSSGFVGFPGNPEPAVLGAGGMQCTSFTTRGCVTNKQTRSQLVKVSLKVLLDLEP